MNKILFLSTVLLFSCFYESIANEIVFISRDKPDEVITDKIIRKIYLKRRILWKNGKRIIPINLSANDSLRLRFTKQIIKKRHRELVEYWNEQYYKGKTPPLVLESEKAVKKFVREVKGAIGYILKKNLDSDLHVIFKITEP